VQLYEKVGDIFVLTTKVLYEKTESEPREEVDCPRCSKSMTFGAAEPWGFDPNVNPWDFIIQ